jgi:class 3 adenylate cyclase
VRAAINFLRSLEVWNHEREAAGLDRVDVRIAINSGQVVVGDIGSATRVDYTVLGNTVNVASRLESYAAKPNQIVIGEGTQTAVKDLVPTEHLGDFQFKGLSRKLAVYRVEFEKVPAQI